MEASSLGKIRGVIAALVTALVLLTPFVSSAAEPVLQSTDELAMFLQTVSGGNNAARVRIRAGIAVAPGKVQEITISPAIPVGAGETINFATRPLRQRRSQVFSGSDINGRVARMLRENAALPNLRPQIIVQMVLVDGNNKVLEKSKAELIDFPALDAAGNKDGVLDNEVTLRLNALEAKVNLGIHRK